MSAPKRIQRSRARGWRMPEDAVYVGRPTRWGNPFTVGITYAIPDDDQPLVFHQVTVEDRQHAYELYVTHADLEANEALIRAELAGHDLACWCPPKSNCHADVLLKIANPTEGDA